MLISIEQKIYNINKRFKMNKTKSILLTLLVMMLWGSLFPVVKIGFIAYNIVTIGDILFFAGVINLAVKKLQEKQNNGNS